MNRNDVSATCHFLDVGQGTCQVILIGKGRAIVVDGGPDPDAHVPLALLKSEKITRIERLIVSHNDRDHDAGAPAILEAYKQQDIGGVYLLRDRRKEDIKLYNYLLNLNKYRIKSGYPKIPLYDLQKNQDEPKTIYKDDANHLELDVVHPNFEASVKWDAEPNAMCAVIRLECGNRRILFTGDAPAKVWLWMIREGFLKPPVDVDVMTAPHHGGHAGTGRQLGRLYTRVVRCEHAVVSVGTTNGHEHPTERGIGALRDANVKNILCTQLTKRCCDDPSQSYPSGLTTPHLHSRSRKSQNPEGGHVACAGSVVARVGEKAITISKLKEHQDAVDGLVSSSHHPLCRA